MLLLGVDTSGPAGSLALCRAEETGHEFQVIETVSLTGGTYSAELIPQLSALLVRHKHSKLDLSGFGVARGPGSFTGLRVGLSSVKALAEVMHKPIAATSVLEAIAADSDRQGKVIAALDAARKQVYIGEYEIGDGRVHMSRESLLTNEEFATTVGSCDAIQVVTPDESVAGMVRGVAVKLVERPRADTYARIGVAKIVAGETISPEELDANYIRRSDAEIFAKPSS